MGANVLECKKLVSLIGRNTKCYFKDKFTFFISMITPIILLVLFVTFLRNVYIDSFKSAFPEGFTVDDRIINGITGAWLMSSILSVSSVTVAFCSNIIMITDKMEGNINDFKVSSVKGTTVSLAYFFSNFFVTFIVLISIMLIGHVYLACVGWYIPVGDALMIVVDLICGILFGTLLAGVVESFISNQGALSAVSTLVSSMYGFICGAYMPLSQFSEGLRNVLCMLPCTYGVGILRNHYMNGYLDALSETGIPTEAIDVIQTSFDAKLSVFGTEIPLGGMYGILLGACSVLLAAYIAIVIIKNKKKK
ncbi:MAG: ABC transporter permease [Clostridia bacterium]|nr:ABC transporter permease [Clostridia bacterium]